MEGGQGRLFEKTEQARIRFAQLINADPDEIAYTKRIGRPQHRRQLARLARGQCHHCPQLGTRQYLPMAQPPALRVEVRLINHRDGLCRR
jgi:hypothetical protein